MTLLFFFLSIFSQIFLNAIHPKTYRFFAWATKFSFLLKSSCTGFLSLVIENNLTYLPLWWLKLLLSFLLLLVIDSFYLLVGVPFRIQRN
jgi:hypothetical protein